MTRLVGIPEQSAMDRFRQLTIFIQVMESGNFTRAAEALAIPRSTVSTEVQALEDRLHCQLLHRTTRRVAPTPDGEQFLRIARDIVETMEDAERMFAGRDMPIAGRLRVDMPSRVGRKIVIPALPAFLAAHPELSIELSTSDSYVDLVASGIDCVLRLGALESSELVRRKLGDVAFVTCASPDYLARHGYPATPEDLSTHLLVNYSQHFPPTSSTLSLRDGGRVREVEMRAVVTVNGAEAYLAATVAGLGLAQIPAFDVADLLESGALVAVVPQFAPPPSPLCLLFARRRNLSTRVRVFQDWLGALLAGKGVIMEPSA